jgi:ankyrin repeat protein
MFSAVEAEDIDAVRKLLNQGVDPNTTDSKGNSILMIAARQGSDQIVALLIARRANVGQRTSFGDTALLMACLKGDETVVRRLLDAGGELNPKQGWAPLHYAAFAGHAGVAKLLLDRGANKDAVAPNTYTALMLAARNGKSAVAKVILYRDPDVNYRSGSGQTALKIARKNDMKELEELLVRSGAVE